MKMHMLLTRDHEAFKDQKEYFSNTKGFKQRWGRLQDIVRQDQFKDAVRQIRLAVNIPEHGYALGIRNAAEVPIEWRRKISEEEYIKLLDGIRELCEANGLAPLVWGSVVRSYIFYAELEETFARPHFGNHCLIMDENEFKKGVDLHESEVEELNEYYPVSIRISRDVSLTQVREFLTKELFDKFIEPIQIMHGGATNKMRKGRVKSAEIRRRNNLITGLKNDGKNSKEIARIVSRQMPDLAVGSSEVNTILKRQKDKN